MPLFFLDTLMHPNEERVLTILTRKVYTNHITCHITSHVISYHISREQRHCTFGCKTIGDEAHYLFRCRHPFFRVTHENFLANIHHIGNIGLDSNCTQNDEHFVTELFSLSDDESLRIFGAHCAKVLAIFKELVG